MHTFSAIIAIITAAAGLYYLINSTAARRLEDIEATHHNRQRIRLRRTGGLVMIAMAVCFALIFRLPAESAAFLGLLVLVLVLVLVMLVLAMMDWRLTWRIRHRRP
jgi:UDP-N-acetylmuramyl pentapeptide phosphotransferase/UDP-N-acetylglucosamine-1-phosphate transferase